MRNRYIAISLSGLLLALAGGCGGSIPPYAYDKEPNPTKREIVIGIADRIRVEVRNNQDLTSEGTVRPDGAITLKLIGTIRADGKTPTQLKTEIAERYAQFIKDPRAVVTISVVEYNSYRFTVSGEVVTPGIFPSKRFVRVLEAIQLAGGPTRFAKREKVQILRCCTPKGEPKKIPIDYNELLTGNAKMNIYIMPDDQVLVP